MPFQGQKGMETLTTGRLENTNSEWNPAAGTQPLFASSDTGKMCIIAGSFGLAPPSTQTLSHPSSSTWDRSTTHSCQSCPKMGFIPQCVPSQQWHPGERHGVFHQCWAGLGARAVPAHLTALALPWFLCFTERQSCNSPSTGPLSGWCHCHAGAVTPAQLCTCSGVGALSDLQGWLVVLPWTGFSCRTQSLQGVQGGPPTSWFTSLKLAYSRTWLRDAAAACPTAQVPLLADQASKYTKIKPQRTSWLMVI